MTIVTLETSPPRSRVLLEKLTVTS